MPAASMPLTCRSRAIPSDCFASSGSAGALIPKKSSGTRGSKAAAGAGAASATDAATDAAANAVLVKSRFIAMPEHVAASRRSAAAACLRHRQAWTCAAP
jgi:hypothetical protein